jgi:hypothetical protein
MLFAEVRDTTREEVTSQAFEPGIDETSAAVSGFVPGRAQRITLELGQCHLLQVIDLGLVSLVKDPLLNSLRPYQSGMAQNLEVFARGWLAHSKLAGNQHSAYTVIHQTSIHLCREMLRRILEPVQYLQSAIAGERSKREVCIHTDSSPSCCL